MASGLFALLVLAVAASSAAADAMVVQPDGRVVVAGGTWPEAGAVARLLPDGSLDPSFGEGGFVLDRRLPGFRALALQPDGDVVGAAVGGFQLARYLPDGSPDPSFADGGVGGSDEPDQSHFRYFDYGPAAVLVRPDGEIVVGGVHKAGGGGATDGLVMAYDESGQPLETVGRVPMPAGPASMARLHGLLERPDGSFVGVGSSYTAEPPLQSRPLLARFLPGSGTDFDPTFGGGAGLVLPPFPTRPGSFDNRLTAVAASGDKLLVAGQAAGTFLIARFDSDGSLDTGFGEGGFVAPTIEGPGDAASLGAVERAGSWANDLAVTSDGGAVLGGGTSQWSDWFATHTGVHCSSCRQPMLIRFDASGRLDPGFGSGGLLRLTKPDGGTFVGEIKQVTALADGKLLVEGEMPNPTHPSVPFVARLNADGSYDPGFGEAGLTSLRFPCTDQTLRWQRRSRCVASERVRLRLSGLHRRRPELSLKVRPNVSWAGLDSVSIGLPRHLRLTRGFRSKLKVLAPGSSAGERKVGVFRPSGHPHNALLTVKGLGAARLLDLRIRRGGLHLAGLRHRRNLSLTLKVGAAFVTRAGGSYAGEQTVKRRWSERRGHRAG